ncbi:hypothetical protein FRB90_009329 [Tulasnella sp. 427]|nr:hypothetical protein FRB90_009329 [Tulasnella sp. 427]
MNILSKFPTELVAAVFAHFITSSDAPLQNHRAPALLISVCRRFRDIVYATPVLWTVVVLSARGGFRHLPEYLGRSKKMPLDVTFYPLDEAYSDSFLRRAAPILEQSHRWRTAYVGMREPWHNIQPLLPSLQSAHILTNFTLSQKESGIDVPDAGYLYPIPQYPSLRVLDISRADVDFHRIQTTHLEQLAVRANASLENSWTPLSALLKRNPSVSHFKLELRLPLEHEVLSGIDGILFLPSATSFELGMHCGNFSVNNVLNKVNIPQLRKLSVGPSHESGKCESSFTKFFETCTGKFLQLKQIRLNKLCKFNERTARTDFETLTLGERETLEVWIGSEKLV